VRRGIALAGVKRVSKSPAAKRHCPCRQHDPRFERRDIALATTEVTGSKAKRHLSHQLRRGIALAGNKISGLSEETLPLHIPRSPVQERRGIALASAYACGRKQVLTYRGFAVVDQPSCTRGDKISGLSEETLPLHIPRSPVQERRGIALARVSKSPAAKRHCPCRQQDLRFERRDIALAYTKVTGSGAKRQCPCEGF